MKQPLAIEADVILSSSDETVARIDEDGVLTSYGPGTTLVTASALGLNTTTPARVEAGAPVLVSITISPSSPSIALGQTLQLTATGILSDGSQTELNDSVD